MNELRGGPQKPARDETGDLARDETGDLARDETGNLAASGNAAPSALSVPSELPATPAPAASPEIRGASLQAMETLLEEMRAAEIAFTLHRHEPLYTVAQSRAMRGELPGLHSKNLFLRDKSRNFFLLTLEEAATADLKGLARSLGARRFSFASPDHLMRLLGVAPGSVSPLGLRYDRHLQVRFFLDRRLALAECVNVHPLRNDHTVALSGPDLVRLVEGPGLKAWTARCAGLLDLP